MPESLRVYGLSALALLLIAQCCRGLALESLDRSNVQLLSQRSPEPSPGHSSLSSDTLDTSALFTKAQRLAIQIICCIFGGLSVAGSLMVCYWFVRMKKLFRHELIVMLTCANITRCSWYFVFPLVVFADGEIRAESAFCQASGFLLQFGISAADFSILFIAIHTAMQVFKPRTSHIGGQGGLHPYRWYIYVAVAIIPVVLAASAFSHGKYAYKYQGPVCNLPLRPYWYRLGISWIPRYIIMIIILVLYVAIYVHAGFTMDMPKLRKPSQAATRPTPGFANTFSPTIFTRRKADRPTCDDGTISPRSTPAPDMRKPSDGTTLHGDISRKASSASNILMNAPHPFNPDPIFITSALPNSQTTSTTSSMAKGPLQLKEGIASPTSPTRYDPGLEPIEMRERRDSIRRHLRLLFVYPLIYFAVWTLPFVVNILNYSSYYVQHPPFPLVFLSYLAVSAMGLIDCVVFSLREQPWKHIARSDGTFFGSFVFWKTLERARAPATPTRMSYLDYPSEPHSPVSPTFRHSRRMSAPVGMLYGIHNHDFAPSSITEDPISLNRALETDDYGDPGPRSAVERSPTGREWFDHL